jgi:hypothetical protein
MKVRVGVGWSMSSGGKMVIGRWVSSVWIGV